MRAKRQKTKKKERMLGLSIRFVIPREFKSKRFLLVLQATTNETSEQTTWAVAFCILDTAQSSQLLLQKALKLAISPCTMVSW
jgi:hypothetical protein